MGDIVNVPFAFETGYQHLPAGVYTIRMESPNILSIRGTSKSGFVPVRAGGGPQPAGTDKVVFRRMGGKYFLGEVWIAEKSGHLDVVKSKAESRLQVAGNTASQTRVELALLQASH